MAISLAEISRPFSRACTEVPSALALFLTETASSLLDTTLRMDLLMHSGVQSGLVDMQPQTPMPRFSTRLPKAYRSAHSGRTTCGTPALDDQSGQLMP